MRLAKEVGKTAMPRYADVIVPPFSDNIDDVQIINWLKSEGDEVEYGEPLVELEVNKAAVELEAPADGILDGIYCWEGEEVIAGERIAVIELAVEDGDEELDFSDADKYDI
jgi:pyruvate/2-oxoglutarate dehydrogenase complex dihydrolipoamide acyltransferase (E2) component